MTCICWQRFHDSISFWYTSLYSPSLCSPSVLFFFCFFFIIIIIYILILCKYQATALVPSPHSGKRRTTNFLKNKQTYSHRFDRDHVLFSSQGSGLRYKEMDERMKTRTKHWSSSSSKHSTGGGEKEKPNEQLHHAQKGQGGERIEYTEW